MLARHPQVLAIVDDHFALLSNAAYHSALPTGAPRWALVRSLTKALGPDIRVALVASDAATSRQLRLRLASGTSWVSHVLQDMVEAALGQTEVAQLMARARGTTCAAAPLLEDALRAQGLPHAAQGDGLNLWIPLPADDQAVALAMARRGWLLRHGEAFCVQDPVPGLRVTLSDIEPEQCAQLARTCARASHKGCPRISRRALRRDMRHAAAIASSSISSRSWPQNSSPA